MTVSDYTVIMFARADRTDDEFMRDTPAIIERWRDHVEREHADPVGDPDITIVHGPPLKGLRLVRDDGRPDYATVAIRLQGHAETRLRAIR